MVLKYRLYRAAEGECLCYCGEWDTVGYALAMAKREPLGLPESEWESTRAAGGLRQWDAPDKAGDEDDSYEWWDGDYCVLRAIYR
jgi:hypothetical protein